MATTLKGELILKDQAVAVVVSRFNSMVTQALLNGAEDVFVRHGGDSDRLTIVWAPGAFELAAVTRRLAESGKYAGVLVLGALIKGGTLHFEVLANGVTRALVDLAAQSAVPIAFGLLTTQTLEQALERAGVKSGNKGSEAMTSLIEMVNLTAKLP